MNSSERGDCSTSLIRGNNYNGINKGLENFIRVKEEDS